MNMNIVSLMLMVVIMVELVAMVSHMILCNKFFKTKRDVYITFEFYSCTLISAIIMAMQVVALRMDKIEPMSFISMIIFISLILSFQVKISGIKKSELN